MMNYEPEATANKETATQTILAVDDEEALGDFLVRVIEQETPYQALSATDAVQALQVVSSIKPSLFILDYQLPGINGLELSDQLHSIEGLETVPTLMVSAASPSRKAMQQRHITFLKKPFNLSDLLQAIEELLPQQEG
jgi:CheY-like chemotaxis protein